MIQLLYLETQPRSGGIFLWALRPMICSRHFSEVKIRASWQMWPGGRPGKLDTLEAEQ